MAAPACRMEEVFGLRLRRREPIGSRIGQKEMRCSKLGLRELGSSRRKEQLIRDAEYEAAGGQTLFQDPE